MPVRTYGQETGGARGLFVLYAGSWRDLAGLCDADLTQMQSSSLFPTTD